MKTSSAQQETLFPVKAEVSAHEIARVFGRAHDLIRNGDGLQPDDALDEFTKVLFVFLHAPEGGDSVDFRELFRARPEEAARQFRELFARFLREREEHDPSVSAPALRLSDRTLHQVVGTISEVDLRGLDFDLKSAALRVFLTGASRRGLGVFLTPDTVVQMVVDAVDLAPGSRLLDPCCGSGSFLLHSLLRWRRIAGSGTGAQPDHDVWACERNERILRLAEINIGARIGGRFHRAQLDSLMPLKQAGDAPDWFAHGSFDAVFTNPPFGVYVDPSVVSEDEFRTSSAGNPTSRFPSEFLFLERCLQLLRPGGILAIVVPNSVLTTMRLSKARSIIDTLGVLVAAVTLPPETFYTAGTQATTSVLFFVKRGGGDLVHHEPGLVFHARPGNIGYDSTGRERSGNELPQVSRALCAYFKGGPAPDHAVRVKPGEEFSDFCIQLTRPATSRASGAQGFKLGDIATVVATGKTPPRDQYLDEDGFFILKVGNLTGSGIDWFARDRNFVSRAYMEKIRASRRAESLILQPTDIVLTSTAHAPKYIGKKVDMVGEVPDFIPPECTFVGEVMMVRANPDRISPLYLLAYLRTEQAQEVLQRMIRGQTAHLYPDDAAELLVPDPGSLNGERLEQLLSLVSDQMALAAIQLRKRRDIAALNAELFS